MATMGADLSLRTLVAAFAMLAVACPTALYGSDANPAVAGATPPAVTRRIVVEGAVQHVGYRLWMREEASALGLVGLVRNTPAGSVEAVVTGAPSAVARIIEACAHGPPAASVISVQTFVVGNPTTLNHFIVEP